MTKNIPLKFPGIITKTTKTNGILEVTDLDLTEPSLNLAEGKDYGHFLGYKIKNLTGMMTSRGCPYKCTYCTHKGIIKYRERSVENVIKELKELKNKGYRYIVLYDDNFLLNKQRVEKIADCLIKEKLRLKLIVQGRVESADYNFYKKIRKAGIIGIMFGIENANQDILDFYKKGSNIEKIKKAMHLCNKAGLLTIGYFILGAPIETLDHFKTNKDFINKAKLDYININILGYYQGSELWEKAVKENKIKQTQTVIYANEHLSNFSYKEWNNLKEILLNTFFKKKTRFLRTCLKLIKLRMLPLFLKVLWNSKTSIIERIKNPFIENPSEVISSAHR